MTNTSVAAVLGASTLIVTLCGCGRVGTLEQPGPLFGQAAQENYRAGEAARDADRNAVSAGQPARAADQTDPSDPNADNAPRTRRDVQAPEQQNVPITQEPVQGIPDIVGPQPSMKPPGA